MQISSALIENIGQDEIKRFLKRRGISENKTGQDFSNWLVVFVRFMKGC